MAENMSVRAILSAIDHGFTSTMNSARETVNNLGRTVKSGIGFGMLTGAGMAAFNSLSNGARGLVSEINSSNKAWKTFEGNMAIIEESGQELEMSVGDVKEKLGKFSRDSIYDASDMASTYAQLAAVGTEGTLDLVKAFGGLASAAEDPKQAMKTLSQQATQMAGKATIAWEDYKLVYEQMPGSMAAVANDMGMSLSELQAQIKEGTVKTEDFFKAIKNVGGSEGFQNLAKEYKSVDEALAGLKETLSQQLGPAFEIVSQAAIKNISGISDKIAEIPAEDIAAKVSAGLEKAQPYWEAAKNIITKVGKALKTVGDFLIDHGEAISKVIPVLLGLIGGYKAFKIVRTVVGPVKGFASHIINLTKDPIRYLPEDLEKTAEGTKNVGKKSKKSSKQVLESAKSFVSLGAAVVMLGFGVLLLAGGFALLAYSAIQLADAGGAVIAVMAGMVFAIAGLMAVAAAFGPAMKKGAVGFVAFGAAIALVGVGALLMAFALQIVAGVLPAITAYGFQGAAAIALLGAGMIVFALGAALAGVACIVLGAGLIVLTAGLVAASVGIIAFGVGIAAAAVGILAMATALMAVNSRMKSIAKNAQTAQQSLKSMKASIKVVENGLSAIGNKAKSAMSNLISSLNNAAAKALSAGQKLGTGFANGMQGGLAVASAIAMVSISAVSAAFMSGYSRAYSAGAFIGIGFANGMRSMLSTVRSVANQLVAQANKAIEAKAKIGSPSKITTQYGKWYGEGYVNGIDAMAKKAWDAARNLVSFPNMDRLTPAMAFGGELSSEYDYYRQANFVIDVPLTVDGKEFARATASYTENELNRRQTRDSRKRGRV